ncbi:MAG: hypothetical protein JSW07_14705 [bacterium]|nr:MAG: hypothetical protein JSW07_14705 [bacterium]
MTNYEKEFTDEWLEEEKAARKQELKDEFKRNAELMAEIQNEEQQKQALALENKIKQEAYAEVLQELGISDQEYQQIVQQTQQEDPTFQQKLFKEGVKTYLYKVAQRPRDPRSGKYISKVEAERRGLMPQQPAQWATSQGTVSPRRHKLEEIAEDRRTGRLNSDEALAEVVKSILPADDPIWRKT